MRVECQASDPKTKNKASLFGATCELRGPGVFCIRATMRLPHSTPEKVGKHVDKKPQPEKWEVGPEAGAGAGSGRNVRHFCGHLPVVVWL